MTVTGAVLLLQQVMLAASLSLDPSRPAGVPVGLTPIASRAYVVRRSVGPAAAISHAQGRCEDPWGNPPGLTAKSRAVHPDRLRERFARSINARDWATAVAGYVAVIDTTLDRLDGSAPGDLARLRQAFKREADSMAVGVARVVLRPRPEWAGALSELEINRFRPVTNVNGELVILQSNARPLGMSLDSVRIAGDQLEAICWSGWSLHRLLNNINFETVPGALVRIEAQERRWERYRATGPLQLPHELLLNRVRRLVAPPRGPARFSPPRLDLVAVHPFAGIELVRTDDGVARTESLAAEVGGFTLWINDWKQHIGASWVLAYDSDGRIGRGPLVRLGGYVTGGVLTRKDAGGKKRTSLLISLDALRLLESDAVPQAVRQAQSIAGEVLDRLPRR